MSEQPAVDWERIDSLIAARPDAVMRSSERGEDLLNALAEQVTDAVERLRAKELGASGEFAELDSQRATQERLAARCDRIIAKAVGDGRADLEAAARGRKAGHEEKAAGLRAAMDARADEQGRITKAISKLEAKTAAIERAREAGSGPDSDANVGGDTAVDLVMPATPEPLGVSDDDLLASLDTLMAETEAAPAPVAPGGPAAAPAPLSAEDAEAEDPLEAAAARVAAAAAAPAAGSAGAEADDLDAEFAKLMASQGESTSEPAPVEATEGDDDIDAILSSLPEMVAVGDDELPEGVELPPEPAVPAVAAAPKPPVRADRAPSKAKPPTKPDVALPKKKKDQPPAKEKSSRTWLWVVVSLLVLGGAFVGTLAAMGKL